LLGLAPSLVGEGLHVEVVAAGQALGCRIGADGRNHGEDWSQPLAQRQCLVLALQFMLERKSDRLGLGAGLREFLKPDRQGVDLVVADIERHSHILVAYSGYARMDIPARSPAAAPDSEREPDRADSRLPIQCAHPAAYFSTTLR
jgi:hypothetical protein